MRRLRILRRKGEDEPRVFEGLSKSDGGEGRSAYNSVTQNAAFSVNMPRFDVRHKLGEIKVGRVPHVPFECLD